MVGTFRDQQSPLDGIPLVVADIVGGRDGTCDTAVSDPQMQEAGAVTSTLYRSKTEAEFEGHRCFYRVARSYPVVVMCLITAGGL